VITVGIIGAAHAAETLRVMGGLLPEMNVVHVDFESAEADVLIINRAPAFQGNASVNCRAAAVNADDARILKSLRRVSTVTATYGFNSKASLTASSVRDDGVVFCVQRPIATLSGTSVCQQEFVVKTSGYWESETAGRLLSYPQFVAYCLLPAVTAALITGKLLL